MNFLPHGPWHLPTVHPPASTDPNYTSSSVLVLAVMNTGLGGEAVYRIAHVSNGHWRPEGGNGNFDKRMVGWTELPKMDGVECGRS